MINNVVTLSVIVPMYNAAQYINECLDSLINQDVPKDDYEVIIVNDGSTDNSAEIVDDYLKKYDNFTVVTQKNQGLSVARNTGIEKSRGTFLFFLDADDWIKKNCLSEIIMQLKSRNLDILRICAANVYGGNVIKRFNLDNTLVVEGKSYFNNEIEVCAPFNICRRELLNQFNLRFYPGIYHEDGEFTPRLYYYAKRVGFMDEIIYFVRQTPNSITRSVNIKKPLDLMTVMRRLHDFSISLDVPPSYLDDKISSAMNQALTQSQLMPQSSQQVLNKAIANNKDLYYHLRRSRLMKYKIEGYLLWLFPNHPLFIYRILRIIH